MAPPSTPDKMPTNDMYGETVNVIVGQGAAQTTFKLHKGLLCFYSGFFEGALRGNFSEAVHGTVKLPTEEVDDFKRFALWINTREIKVSEPDTIEQLCRLWVLADRREVPLLMNQCIDTLRDKIIEVDEVPSDFKYIYENTTEESGLRRFALDMAAKLGCAYLLDDHWGWRSWTWPVAALRDLLRVVWDLDEDNWRWDNDYLAEVDLCEYHDHEAGVRCARKAAKGWD